MVESEKVQSVERLTCGVVMPISSIDGMPEAHWADVLDIVMEACAAAGFKGALVSNADESGLIHKRILQNLYENPIVVCDVSAKNPNVMFELGLRLAFDKPTIVIKDDKTSYSFDTSGIEHLEYPRDMRFAKIVDFKARLAEKIKATVEAARSPNYSTFLKNFGAFTTAKLESKEVGPQEFVLEELRAMRSLINQLVRPRGNNRERTTTSAIRFPLNLPTSELRADLSRALGSLPGVHSVHFDLAGGKVEVNLISEESEDQILSILSMYDHHAKAESRSAI